MTAEASCADVRSRPSSIWSTVVNSASASSRPCAFRLRSIPESADAPSAYVGKGRENPHRRCAKGDDAQYLDGVAGGPSGEEIVGQCRAGGVDSLDAANLLDQKMQRRIDEVSI